MNIYTGDQNEVSIGQVIITDRDIYRKILNNELEESYDLYMLSQFNDKFVWQLCHGIRDIKGSEIVDIGLLSYTIGNSALHDNKKYNFLTIYKVDGNNTLTHTATFNDSYDIPFYWKELDPELNLSLINRFVISRSLLDIPTHIDLTRVAEPEPTYGQNDGWNNVINNEGWFSFQKPDIKQDTPSCSELFSDAVHDQLPSPAPAPAHEPAPVHEPTPVHEPAPVHEPVPAHEPATDHCVDSDNSDDSDDSDDSLIDMILLLEDEFEEERIDPYTGEWYTESEFIDYYRGDTEWNHQAPNKIILREEYFKFANTFSYLGAKKFIFLFNKYEQTFR